MNRVNIKPLSVNRSYNVKKGRISKTPECEAYFLELLLKLPVLPQERFKGFLKLSVTMGVSNPRSDLDNTLKPFQDILQQKYGFNDHQIYQLDARKAITHKGKEYIEFMVEQVEIDDE